jgi:hypothetical protein
LRASYERLLAQFANMQEGVTRGYEQVRQALARVEAALDRNAEAFLTGCAEAAAVEGGRPSTACHTWRGRRRNKDRTEETGRPMTPADKVRARAAAGEEMTVYDEIGAMRVANQAVSKVISDRGGHEGSPRPTH